MKSIIEVKNQIQQAPEDWQIPLIDFVDDFRRHKEISAIDTPYPLDNEKMDALLASTIEHLCHEQDLEVPNWILGVPSLSTSLVCCWNRKSESDCFGRKSFRISYKKNICLGKFYLSYLTKNSEHKI
jgi:hypothetical protein